MATGQASDICVWNRGAVGLTCARAVLLTNTTPALRRNAVAIFDIVLFLFEELVCTGPALQKADTQELLHDRCYFPNAGVEAIGQNQRAAARPVKADVWAETSSQPLGLETKTATTTRLGRQRSI